MKKTSIRLHGHQPNNCFSLMQTALRSNSVAACMQDQTKLFLARNKKKVLLSIFFLINTIIYLRRKSIEASLSLNTVTPACNWFDGGKFVTPSLDCSTFNDPCVAIIRHEFCAVRAAPKS
jgi:hypothetical protein